MLAIDLNELLSKLDNGLPEKTLLDLAALVAPMPTDAQIESEMARDKLLNPHNEPYHSKPPQRERDEIIWDLRYRHAHHALAARKLNLDQLYNKPGSGRPR